MAAGPHSAGDGQIDKYHVTQTNQRRHDSPKGGGQAMVPFAPRNDRPVYCSSCFDKVRAGTIQETANA